ncbi:hypothetical protein [Egicoccus halophilus]|uniref:hypothetical protein n=1 Tax=Egicoccus halophilus TaxID=1670830 RepID=UPI00103062CC|nr:hypothetical protein [Egicoccus halophilus]
MHLDRSHGRFSTQLTNEAADRQLPETNDVIFLLFDNYDDPFDDPSEWTCYRLRVPGRWTSLELALRAAAERALQFAGDSAAGVYAVDVSMHRESEGGMTVASIHVWHDHAAGDPWIPALRTHLDVGEPHHG